VDPETAGGASGSGDAGSVPLYNPLGADIGVAEFISRIIRMLIGFVGALALLMFVYGGVMWMTAGDSKRVDTAKEILKNSTIGLLLIFFSYSIVSVVFSLLGSA
jgi:type IV secretory pathway VirB2 component (pilin)